jgi:hypothetical protein
MTFTYNTTEIERNLFEALTLARVTYTHVWAQNAEGRGKGEDDTFVETAT